MKNQGYSVRNIDIALATYNGLKFLPEQLDSLLAQTEASTRVLIRDDGSTDGTVDLLKAYDKKFPERLSVLSTDSTGEGASGNFSRLLLSTDAPYVLLCDQDDVWDLDKVSASLQCIQKLEAEFGKDMPILVHTDLRVVDRNLSLISASFFKFQNLDAQANSLKELLVQNMITGCTVIVNRALLSKALPVPADAIMHDWWLALVAAAFGKIGFVDRATMSYRQHGNNTVGAKGWNLTLIASRLKQLLSGRGTADLLRPGIVQAQAFVERYKRAMSADQLLTVNFMANLMDSIGIVRVISAARVGLCKQGALRTLGFYWALLIARF